MIKLRFIIAVSIINFSFNVSGHQVMEQPQLKKVSYQSELTHQDRQYFLYLPARYQTLPDKKWPIMLFLHGNGERGNGTSELDFVLNHGPLYEAWIQKKDLPFIIISPQLPMFDQLQEYMTKRKLADVPQRLDHGTPARPERFSTPDVIIRNNSIVDLSKVPDRFPQGWELIEHDLMNMLEQTEQDYRVDRTKRYLTGLSYGGAGTWYLASKYPEKFAAIAPVVGWGHPNVMAPIAKHKVPVWQFAAGRDKSVPIAYFYAGINKLEQLGHTNVRFTVHEDMGHDAWTRVYQSGDLYQWLLSHSK